MKENTNKADDSRTGIVDVVNKADNKTDKIYKGFNNYNW